MAYDELELDRIGDRKTAVFFIISDTTQTYNFLVALAFSQMFNLLCERADNVHGGRLPHHVRVLWDEAAKEDLRIAAGLTTNMIANMGKGKNISMETLVRICETLNCGILDVIELEQDENNE